VVLWGGPKVAGRLGSLLAGEGVRVVAFVDVDPERIGRRRRSVPVIAPDDLDAHRGRPLVAAVGNRGARALIRADVASRGWSEGRDFWCAA